MQCVKIKMFLKLLVLFSMKDFMNALITEDNVNLDILNRNLHQGLKIHPKLQGQNDFTNDQKYLIDKYFDDYFDITMDAAEKMKEGTKSKKRSLDIPWDEQGVRVFDGLKKSSRLEKYNFTKLEFFNRESSWFIAALEYNNTENYDNLLLFEYKNKNLTTSDKWMIPTVVTFTTFSGSPVFIIVKAKDDYYSGVWHFDGEDLKQIQNLDLSHAFDMKIWSIGSEIFMAVNYEKENSSLITMKTEIYKWLGSHFDSVQIIEKKSQKLSVFGEKNYESFLTLIINNENREFLEIYRYNFQEDIHEVIQRIPTSNCQDVKFFTLKKNKGFDLYLAVANYFNDDGSSKDLPSIIYRYVDDYFLPFQNLNIKNILEFFPVEGENNQFVLVAETEFQSLKTFQYDGWTFQENFLDINEDLPQNLFETESKIFLATKQPIIIVQYYENEILELFDYEFTEVNELKKFRNELLERCQKSLKKLESKRMKRGIESSEKIERKINEVILVLDEFHELLTEQSINNLETDEIISEILNVQSIHTNVINNQIIDDIINTKLDTNEDSNWQLLSKMETIQIDTNINPRSVNGKDSKDLIRSNNLEINNLTLTGIIELSSPISSRTLNNLIFDESQVLLMGSSQNFDKLSFDILESKNLNPVEINKRPLNEEIDTDKHDVRKVQKIDELVVKKIIVGEFLNDVDMRTLNKYTLRIFGDQKIDGVYTFEELQTNNFEIELLSSKDLKNLVRIDSGDYKLEYDVQFMENMRINELNVESFLDLIPVLDGKLQVLLKNSSEIQHVKAEKTMSDVELLNPINLQGNIQSEELNKINPVISVDDAFIFVGDFEITGNTTIEKILMANDIVSLNNGYSAKMVLQNGLLLTSKEIDTCLNFEQQLNVDEIFIDNINGYNPSSWVVTGTTINQFIYGQKIFTNDVNITGNSNFLKINNIDCSELENSVMRKNSEQIVTGKHTLSNVVSINVLGNHTVVGKTLLGNILTTNTIQKIQGSTMINEKTNSMKSSSKVTKLSGTLNGIDFTNVAKDSVVKPVQKPLSGHKIFNNLTISQLQFPKTNQLNHNNDILIIDDVYLEHLIVEDVEFMKSCNNKNREIFEDLQNDQEITSLRTNFTELVILGNVIVGSGFLNDVNLEDFERNTMKVDEENVLGDVFLDGSVISDNPVIVDGNIDNVDLENFITSASETKQFVSNLKHFQNIVTVFGNVTFSGLVNEFNMSDACNFGSSKVEGKSVELLGNAIFAKGPHVDKIFNTSIKFMNENAWFKNREKEFENHVEFENVTSFNDSILEGLIDGVSLNNLRDKYFSKSKKQTITGGIVSGNHINFMGNLISPQISLNGFVNDIKFSDLPRTILLQDEDQIFEQAVYLEDVEIDHLNGEFKVNNWNLETDLMRYDRENLITGSKSFELLHVENVQIAENSKIQNVDLLDWMENAILKKGRFNINKRKIFRNNVEYLNGINLNGIVNGGKFNNQTIMLKNIEQNVIGEKTFAVDKFDRMRVKNMKLKGLVNNMDISKLVDDNVMMNDLIFKSPMKFHNNVHTKNLILKKPYKRVRMDQIISDIYSLKETDNFIVDYETLLNNSYNINRNLREQATYLQNYRELQELENPDYIVNACCNLPALIYFQNQAHHHIMGQYFWDVNRGIFTASDSQIDMGDGPNKIRVFTSNRHQFLYIENANEDESVRGNFIRFINLRVLVDFASITSKGVRDITPLRIHESECLLLIYEDERSPNVFCGFDNNSMQLFQNLGTPGKYVQSASTKIEEVPYIFLIRTYEDHAWKMKRTVEIWNLQNSTFAPRQILYSSALPSGIATITYKTMHYLSIAYQGDTLGGHVDILKFDADVRKFNIFQRISLINDNPVRVEFGVLPSTELILFLQDSRSLSLYKYEGISGFLRKIVPSNNIRSFKQFNMEEEHFVLIETYNGVLKILQAIFKGKL